MKPQPRSARRCSSRCSSSRCHSCRSSRWNRRKDAVQPARLHQDVLPSAAAALLSVTLVPALMIIFVRGRIIPEAKNPAEPWAIAIYRPVIRTVLKAKTLTIAVAVFILAVSVWPVTQVGSEFMPTSTRARCFTCRRRCPACPLRNRPSCCKRRIGLSNRSPRLPPSTAKRAALRPRPIRRRSKCSRPTSTLSRRRNGGRT